MKSNLPKGWALTTLRAICQKAASVSPANNPQSTFQYIDIASIDNSIYRVAEAKEYVGKDAPSRARQLVYTADTLISTVRPYLRKIAFVTEELNGQIASTGFTVVRAKEGINPKYVFYNAISDGFINSLCEKQRGASYPAVRDSDVFEQQIPLPPLAEQTRIVVQLDNAMRQIESSQARLEKLPGLLRQLRQAVLAAAVSGRLTEAWRAEHPQKETGADLLARIRAERRAQWEAKQLDKLKGKQLSLNDNWKQKYEEPAEPDTSELPELPDGWAYVSVEQLTNGARPSSYGVLVPGPDVEDGIPMIRVGDINDGKVNVSNLKKIAPNIAADFKRTKLEGGEMLISLVGTIGRTAIAPPEVAGANTARAVGVIPLVESIDKHWIEFYFRNPDKVVEMVTKSHEVARKTLNLDDVRRTAVVLPPIVEQQEIVRQVNHYFALADALEARFEQAAALVEQLPQALLAKAFSGQFVPQGPNDEPASVLLERLRNAPVPTKIKRERAPKFTVNQDSDVPQPLLDILTQHPDGISPEKLFSLAGFTDADIDAFYQELAVLRPRLVEDKPTGEAARAWPKTSATLRLKSEPHAD